MSPVQKTFPFEPAPAVPTAPTQIIETVGVEVIESSPPQVGGDWKAPANGNDVIPFASTLRRVG